MKGKKQQSARPDNAISVTTYAEFESFVQAFATGYINLLIIVGEHGLSKGSTVRRMLPEDTCWIEGNASPFGMYMKLYEFRDRFVVIDDVDDLVSNKAAVRLLKGLCQTEERKNVAWPTAARELKQENIPREYDTSSRVVIISNDWSTMNRNVAAVQDRGHTIVFEPTALEVHEKTAEWFDDKEIYSWFGQNLHRVTQPSMRLYFRARELKHAGLDWQQLSPLATDDRRKRLVVELLADESLESQEDRASRFVSRGGGCRATYFNHLRKLRPATSK